MAAAAVAAATVLPPAVLLVVVLFSVIRIVVGISAVFVIVAALSLSLSRALIVCDM